MRWRQSSTRRRPRLTILRRDAADILDRVNGIEAVLHALFLAKGRTDIALARLRVLADLLALKGTPSVYLNSFLAENRVADSEPDASSGGGQEQEDRNRVLR
jgi:hypothetical protein